MAEGHDRMVAQYRAKLVRKKYRIEKKNPFVDYRPDICAIKGGQRVFVEVEIEQTLNGNHTFDQLQIMHRYLMAYKSHRGVLVVPKAAKEEARFMIESVFGDGKIKIEII